MALTVKFWTFGKRENATSTPPNSTATATYNNVELKDNCSIVNPALKILTAPTVNLTHWNYCFIKEFNRYYYVNDWQWSLGIWTAELEVDVLASFRYEIGNQHVYVLRAYQTSNYNYIYNGNIVDSTYPTTAEAATYTASSITNPFAGLYASNDGSYIVGIVSKNAAGVKYYAFNFVGFRMFCTQLYNYSSGWLNIDVTEISEDLQKALVNPFQYVVSAYYLPIPVSWFVNNSIGTATTSIDFGWWSVTVSAGARVLNAGTLYSLTTSVAIPKHPQAASRGAYLNLAPTSIYTLRYYPFGTIDIDSEAISNWNTLDLYTDVDICTGRAILTIAVNGKSNPIRTIESTISAPIPTAAINVDYMSMGSKSTAIAAAASAIGQLTSGSGGWFENMVEKGKNFVSNLRSGNTGAIASGAKKAASNILSTALAAKATAEITGQQGSYTLFDTQTLTLSGRFLPIADEDLEHRGRPLCQNMTINSLYGFIMVADADINIPCTEREKAAIKSYMESGFYYY